MLYKILLLVGITWLVSCKREATIELPSQDPRLVVTCFISPQNPNITAVVRTSIQKYNGSYVNYTKKGTTENDVTNAMVMLTDGSKNIQIPFDTLLSCYNIESSQFSIESGKSYTLTVSTPDGKKVTASTTVPTGTLQTEYSKPNFKMDSEFQVEFSFNVIVKDIPNQTNYVAAYYNIMTITTATSPYIYIPPDEPFIFETDEELNREGYNGTVSYFNYTGDTITSIPVTLLTLNCSKEFYLFNKSSREAVYNDGNPFGEPILVYSNIEGGFGCFGAYTEQSTFFLAK